MHARPSKFFVYVLLEVVKKSCMVRAKLAALPTRGTADPEQQEDDQANNNSNKHNIYTSHHG